MAGEFISKIIGLDKLRDALAELVPEMRRGEIRRVLRAGAEVVLKKAFNATPKLSKPVYRRGKVIRNPGTLRNSLKIRTSRDATREGNVGVFVNIKPAKGAERGAYKPNDPFYWRFVHFATRKNKNPKPFLTEGGKELQGGALTAIQEAFPAAIARIVKKVSKQ